MRGDKYTAPPVDAGDVISPTSHKLPWQRSMWRTRPIARSVSPSGRATWIVLERRVDGMRYARVAPERIAGTIDVTCHSVSADETRVTVTYDVTSLGPEGSAFVAELSAGYDAFLESWRQEILGGLAGGRSEA